ncbi:MAG TPA: ester cyclase [Chitinophagaceae bacterium]
MSEYSRTHRWFDEVWHKGNEKAIDELMHETAITHGLDPDNATGTKVFKSFYHSFRSEFPSIHVELEPLVKTDDTEVSHCTVTGKSAKGHEVSFTGIVVVKFKNGKIVEAWNAFDFLKMYQQTGHRLVAVEGVVA